jgi:hypothetical protein
MLLVMRRALWSRVTALFVGIWFVAVAAGPELTHACPMHGGHAIAASLGQHSGHAAVSDHHSASNTESTSHHGAQCTCLGQCCSTGPVAILAARATLGDAQTIASRDAGLPDYAYVPVAAQHVLPLANAPPLSA